ncbi:2396_t:CDS:1, partial [Gigaspora rosea]
MCISNCLSKSKNHLIYADDKSDENKIEDYDNSKEEKYDKDNGDKEFDENEEFNEIKESTKMTNLMVTNLMIVMNLIVMNLSIGLASGQNALSLLKTLYG